MASVDLSELAARAPNLQKLILGGVEAYNVASLLDYTQLQALGVVMPKVPALIEETALHWECREGLCEVINSLHPKVRISISLSPKDLTLIHRDIELLSISGPGRISYDFACDQLVIGPNTRFGSITVPRVLTYSGDETCSDLAPTRSRRGISQPGIIRSPADARALKSLY